MNKEELMQLTDKELLAEKKKYNRSKIFHATFIGILAGILIFGFVAWSLSPNKKPGFLIPMLFPLVVIYRLIKNPKKNQDLEKVLEERHLN